MLHLLDANCNQFDLIRLHCCICFKVQEGSSPVGVIIVVVLLMLVGVTVWAYKRSQEFAVHVRPQKKKGAKAMKRDKLKGGLQVLGD